MPKLDGLWAHTCHLKNKTKYGYVFMLQSEDNYVTCKGAFYAETMRRSKLKDIREFRWSGYGKVSRNQLSLTYLNEIDKGFCTLRLINGSCLRGIWKSNRRRDTGEEEYRKVHGLEYIAPFNPIFPGRAVRDVRMAFVLMPFAKKYDRVYKNLKKTLESLKYRCVRADEIFGPGAIMKDIWTSILSAQFIVAELSGRNPNVFYELGIAHCLGKEVILIARSVKQIPFDLRHMRVVLYSNMTSLCENLAATIESMDIS